MLVLLDVWNCCWTGCDELLYDVWQLFACLRLHCQCALQFALILVQIVVLAGLLCIVGCEFINLPLLLHICWDVAGFDAMLDWCSVNVTYYAAIVCWDVVGFDAMLDWCSANVAYSAAIVCWDVAGFDAGPHLFICCLVFWTMVHWPIMVDVCYLMPWCLDLCWTIMTFGATSVWLSLNNLEWIKMLAMF